MLFLVHMIVAIIAFESLTLECKYFFFYLLAGFIYGIVIDKISIQTSTFPHQLYHMSQILRASLAKFPAAISPMIPGQCL
jgi:hypothetical protein